MFHSFIIIVDAYSKCINAHITSSSLPEAPLQKLVDIYVIYKISKQIASNNGTGFTNSQTRSLMNLGGDTELYTHSTQVYHPFSLEQQNRLFKPLKKCFCKLEGNLVNRIAGFFYYWINFALIFCDSKKGLQNMIDAVHGSSKKWCFEAIVVKCAVVVFRNE